MARGTVKVACSRAGRGDTRGLRAAPGGDGDRVERDLGGVQRDGLEGFSSFTVIRSVAAKLAAARFGSTAMS